MNEKAKKHPLPVRSSKVAKASAKSKTPITPIGYSRLSETIKDGGRIYQLMVESVRDYAIFMLDPNGHVASWNREHSVLRATLRMRSSDNTSPCSILLKTRRAASLHES